MRPLLLGLLLAAAFSLGGGEQAAGGGGNVAGCSALAGDAARACYTREVAASLGVAGETRAVKTTSFVCELHERIGSWQ